MGRPKVTDEEITAIGPILQRLMWADNETREKIQKYGVNVTPINFYSNTPSMDEIRDSFEYKDGDPPYFDESIFHRETLKETLRGLHGFAHEFDPAIEGDEETCEEFFWGNSQFSFSDAMSYYCFVRMKKPRRIVEIGSGFSTLVALEATRRNESGSIYCVEPYPRPFLERIEAITLDTRKAQEFTGEELDGLFEDGDFLFIDSTHTVKTGSDCLHIYLRLLPRIKKEIYVHVHDVFLPFGMPREWLLDRQIFWTEQYLLMAFLIDNVKAQVLYGSHYNSKAEPEAMSALMDGKYPALGGSLWFKYDGR